jgi:hypothetical protein
VYLRQKPCLIYSFHKRGVYQIKKEKYILEIPKKLLTFAHELFDSIAPQNAEIRTVAKSLPKHSQNQSNILLD